MCPKKTKSILLVLLLAPLMAGMDSCRSGSKDDPKIEAGKLLRTLGDRGPIRLAVMEYRQGSAKGQIWLVTVEASQARLSLYPAEGQAKPLTDLIDPIDAESDFAAINGGFYDEKGPLGLVVADGHEYKALRKDGGSGIFLVAGGQPDIVHRDRFQPPDDMEMAVQSIDRLVSDGRALVKRRSEMPRDARSVVAVDGLGSVYFLAIFDERAIASSEGNFLRLSRQSTETGATLYALAEFLARPISEGGLQVKHALNLDGGFSTAVRVRIGGVETGVIAYLDTINALVATPSPVGP